MNTKHSNTHNPDDWASLRLLNVYRLFVTFILLATLYYLEPDNSVLGQRNTTLFTATLLSYLALSLIFIACLHARWPRFESQVYLQVYVDIGAITLLMHASGGTSSGLGILMVVAIAGTALITMNRFALLFAALGSLALLGEQFYTHATYGISQTAYLQAGALGATLLVTALLAMVLARRSRRADTVARRRTTERDNLAKLNEQIIQQMASALLFVSPMGKIRISNSSAHQLLNMPRDTESLSLRVVSEPLATALEHWRKDRSQQPQPTFDKKLGIELNMHFLPLGNAGTLIRVEDNFALKQQMLQSSLASLGRLTANIAHEIRNPLGAISHAAQLLEESASISQGDNRLVQIVITQSQRMNKIIEDIMQLSRQQKVTPEKINLHQYLTEFAADFCTQQQLQANAIRITAEATTHAWIDPDHLHQVLWNLCNNSVLHSKSEDLVINLTVKETPNPADHRTDVNLEISDNGVGIPTEKHAEVFEPFYTSSHRGTGLGLYIARELCEFSRAQLSLLPSGNGTCFRITFGLPPEITT